MAANDIELPSSLALDAEPAISSMDVESVNVCNVAAMTTDRCAAEKGA